MCAVWEMLDTCEINKIEEIAEMMEIVEMEE